MPADERLPLRLARAEKATLAEAAAAVGVTLSRFVRSAALDHAATVLGEKQGFTRVPMEQFSELTAALDAPASAAPALLAAAKRGNAPVAEPQAPIETEALSADRHRVEAFDCSNEGLTAWLRRNAFARSRASSASSGVATTTST